MNNSTKLNYQIIEVSSEDESYPILELQKDSSKLGFQSQRFTQYPLEILIQLSGYSNIEQLKLMTHAFKIPSQVDILMGFPQQMEYIGSVTFDNNEKHQFQKKEMKTIILNRPSKFIKLIILGCHQNKLNIFNQIGIIKYLGIFKINIFGTIINQELQPVTQRQTLICRKIFELSNQKEKAKKAEDFKEAKILKEIIEKLQQVNSVIEQLEIQKKIAVQREDFERAQQLKYEIQQINIHFENYIQQEKEQNQLGNNPSFNNQNSVLSNHNQIDTTFKELNISNIIDQSFDKKTVNEYENSVEINNIKKQDNSQDSQDDQLLLEDQVQMIKNIENSQQKFDQSEIDINIQDRVNTQDQNEKPIVARQDYTLFEQLSIFFPKDSIQLLLNKQKWNDRVEGLKLIQKNLEEFKNIDAVQKEDLIQASIQIVEMGVQDKIDHVFFQTLSVFKVLLSSLKKQDKNHAKYTTILQNIIDLMLEKLSQQSYKDQVCEMFEILAKSEFISMGLLLSQITQHKYQKTNPKNIMVRLELLQNIIKQNKIKESDFLNIIDFELRFIKDQNQEVRKQSIDLLIELYKINPEKVKLQESKYSDNINVMQKIGQIDGKSAFCEYCKQVNPDFYDQKKLANHVKQCYMVTSCVGCNVMIEVIHYTEHLISACRRRGEYKECKICKIAILQKDYNKHIESQICQQGQNLCQLCQFQITEDSSSLQKHLKDCKQNKKLTKM